MSTNPTAPPTHLAGITAQVAWCTVALRDTLDKYDGKVLGGAARDHAMLVAWTKAEPETRTALLLTMAWHSRSAPWVTIDREGGEAALLADELHRHAADFAGDSEAWHGAGFPLPKWLMHPGANLASSTGFDRQDVAESFTAVLFLTAAIPRPVPPAEA